MKKSSTITLGALFVMAVASCQNSSEPEWTTGADQNGYKRDTSFHGSRYRYYNGGWYPCYNNMICPGYYRRPYSYSEISRPSFKPRPMAPSLVSRASSFSRGGISTGGFGSSGHSSFGS